MTRRVFFLFLALLPAFLPSCASTGEPMDSSPEVQARNAAIRAEPRGDYYIGRRYFVAKTRFWGYLRRPGQLWEEAPLVLMDENRVLTPDRLPENTSAALSHGFDHNSEYKIQGQFLPGRKDYDPNADMELPVFQPSRFELTNPRPGFLFSPRDRYDPRYIPAREVKRTTPARM